jgi:hypothetical protein
MCQILVFVLETEPSSMQILTDLNARLIHDFSPYPVDRVSTVPLHYEEFHMATNFEYAPLTLSSSIFSSTDMSSRSDLTSASKPLLAVLLVPQFCL